ALYDRNGGAIVIEFVNGETQVYENLAGVMTNAPAFPWHVRNMDNYAFLTNIDKNAGKFNNLNVTAPDAGNALVALPSTQTAPGRFVKAAYYSNYAYKAKAPDEAIKTLSHVMNNFDRAKNMAVDKEQASKSAKANSSSEVTFFTAMKDLNQGHFYIRTINSINFTKFDINKLSALKSTKVVTLQGVDANTSLDGTDLFLK
ncbi:MAG: linear amide C-N hydrolase, partial [Fluviibacter sp.]